jgi:hypothetical protein
MEQPYRLFTKAKGHGGRSLSVETDPSTNLIEIETLALPVADQIVAGQVVDSNEKPVISCQVSLSGEGQPEDNTTTDGKGRFKFKVCEGQVQFWASSQMGYANASGEAGDTNIIIRLIPPNDGRMAAPARPSLIGKTLPDLAKLGFTAHTTAGGRV